MKCFNKTKLFWLLSGDIRELPSPPDNPNSDQVRTRDVRNIVLCVCLCDKISL